MPTILHTTAVREPCEGFTLSIRAHHTLIADKPSADAICAKGRLPGVDIVSRGDVVLAFAGVSNGRPISTDEMFRSMPLIHFHNYLRKNERSLGVSTVSAAYIDEDGHIPKVNLSPLHSHETEGLFPKVHLTTIKITFVYSTTEEQCLDAHDIFSKRPFLPFTAVLDSVVEKVVSLHLVRRYPLIFGLLSQKLRAETGYCPRISHNLSCVIARSSNPQFQRDANQLLRRLRKRLQAEATRITDAYEHYLGVDEGQGADICQPIEAGQTSEENILTIALSRLMRLRLRAPPFKATSANLHDATKFDVVDEFSQDNVDDERFVSKADSVPAIKWEDLRYPSTNKDEEDEGDHVVLYDSCDACSNGDGDDDDDDDYSWNLAPAHLDATEDDGGSYTSYPHGGIDEELLLQRPNPNHADPTEFVDIDEVLRLHDERDVIHRPTSPFESPESSQEDSLKTPHSSQVDYIRISGFPEDTDDTLWLSSDSDDTSPNDASLRYTEDPSAVACCDNPLEEYVLGGLDSPRTTFDEVISAHTLEPLDCLYDPLDDHADSFEGDSSDRYLCMDEDDIELGLMYTCDDIQYTSNE